MSLFYRDNYRILQSDRDEIRRARRKRLGIIALVLMISTTLFAYPLVKDYKTKWDARKAARKIAHFLNTLKTQAMIKHVPIQAVFIQPDIIEVYEVSNCGPRAVRTKLWNKPLSEFQKDIHFISPATIRKHISFNEPLLDRFCYDPVYGSSIHADGLAYGSFFIKHVLSNNFDDAIVELSISGASGDIEIF